MRTQNHRGQRLPARGQRFVMLLCLGAAMHAATVAASAQQTTSPSPAFIAGETVRMRTKQIAVFETATSERGTPTKASTFRPPIVTVAQSADGRRLQLSDATGRRFWVGAWTVDRPSVVLSTSQPRIDCAVQSGVRGGVGCTR